MRARAQAASIDQFRLHLAGFQCGAAAREVQRDALRKARVSGGGGIQTADGAVGKTEDGGHGVLAFHAVHGAGAGQGGDLRGQPGQAEQQVQGVDGLRNQHAAAVTRQRATARLVVITLRAPPAHAARGAGQLAQLAAGDQGGQGHRRFTQPVLQHHGQLYLLLLAHADQFFSLGQ